MYSIEEFQQGLVQGLETFLKDKYGDGKGFWEKG